MLTSILLVFYICYAVSLHRKGKTKLCFLFVIVSGSFSAFAQPTDSLKSQKIVRNFQKQKNWIRQAHLIDELQKNTLKAKAYLKHGIDTLGINKDLEEINNWAHIAGDGVLVNKGTIQTSRNLITTTKILMELLNRVNVRKVQLDAHEKNLSTFKYISDSLNASNSLYDFPEDSAALAESLQKWEYIGRGLAPVDSGLKVAISHIHALQGKVNFEVYKLNTSLEELEAYQKELSRNFFQQEVSGLTGHVAYKRPISEIIHFSKVKSLLLLSFYARHHTGKIFLLLILTLACSLFLRSLKTILIKENLLRNDFAGQLALRYPELSAIVIIFSLFQFIFPDPPFIFNVLLWIIPAIVLTIIFYGFISRYWMRFWICMLILFITSCYGNLILQASRMERWGMLIVALLGVITSTYFLLGKHKKELRERLILSFIALAILFEAASVIANFSGRYNLAKSMFISGYSNVIVGILFLWTIRLINESLTLASNVYTRQEKKLFYINFERVGEKAPTLLYILLVVGWLVLLGRNFYEYKIVSEPLKNFFLAERKIGSYTFTINNILIFFGIMLLAAVISRIISFFASDKRPPHILSPKQRKAGIGSWLLLIRVGVISAGLFLALAASGFPLDRITILLGALGVGVGLGLQGLVNNLVSGLIIAFEKPVNVGDVVEISGQVGTMKSIGFRSSVVSSINGADMVIPNGDLLNTHLINWTLGGNRRRMDIQVLVSYGTDLENTHKILLELLNKEEKVLKFPLPIVLFHGFGNSAIEVQILFWVEGYREGFRVKSTVIAAIDAAFRAHNIVIPFPQQDIHIHNDAGNNNAK